MFHPEVLAALAKERRNTMLAEASAARLARPARETRPRPYRQPWSRSALLLRSGIAWRSVSAGRFRSPRPSRG